MGKKIEYEDNVDCMICGEKFSALHMHLRYKHNMTIPEYKEKYPGSDTTSKRRKSNLGAIAKERWDNSREYIMSRRTPLTEERKKQISGVFREYSMTPSVRLERKTRMTGEKNINYSGDNKILRTLKDGIKITVGEFNSMFEKQNGLCAICGKPPDMSVKRPTFCVDHDHETGKIRGLLCNRCNVGLGNFSDKKELLFSAIDYLSKEI
jgi:hypothetical protein